MFRACGRYIAIASLGSESFAPCSAPHLALVHIVDEDINIVEELRDNEVGPSIDLILQVYQVTANTVSINVALG